MRGLKKTWQQGPLATRALLVVSIVLLVGLFVAASFIERAYIHSAEKALQDRLQGYAVALIAAIELDEQGQPYLANPLSEPRFFNAGSGLYAQVKRNNKEDVWSAPSLDYADAAEGDERAWFPSGLARNERRFTMLNQDNIYSFSIGVSWDDQGEVYTFSVAESLRTWQADNLAFRNLLWGWMSVVALLLIVLQGVVLRMVLRPMRRIADDIKAMEAGNLTRLHGVYPVEVRPLADNLNKLLDSQQIRTQRARESLADLAHSLKTPLAVLRPFLDGRQNQNQDQVTNKQRDTAQQQIERMSQLIEYQLQRAATAGQSVLARRVNVLAVVKRLKDMLSKVYADKDIQWYLDVDTSIVFPGDEGDLMEVLGNLLDNACKWCRDRVRISVHMQDGRQVILVEDDGEGVAAGQRQTIFDRGVRGDEFVPGHGIGLAIVREIVAAYNGDIEVTVSEWGGAGLVVSFPAGEGVNG